MIYRELNRALAVMTPTY
nr:hypothetical protein [Escherichia coli]